MKGLIVLIGLVLLIGITFASYGRSDSKNIIKDIFFNPEKYPRLPDNLEPYLCENGKVDLDLAALDVKKGMDPAYKRKVDKSELNCGDN